MTRNSRLWEADLVAAADPIAEAIAQRRGRCHWCSSLAVYELIVSKKSSSYGQPIFWDKELACDRHHDDPKILEAVPSVLIEEAAGLTGPVTPRWDEGDRG